MVKAGKIIGRAKRSKKFVAFVFRRISIFTLCKYFIKVIIKVNSKLFIFLVQFCSILGFFAEFGEILPFFFGCVTDTFSDDEATSNKCFSAIKCKYTSINCTKSSLRSLNISNKTIKKYIPQKLGRGSKILRPPYQNLGRGFNHPNPLP